MEPVKTVEHIIAKYPKEQASLVPLLQDIQEQKGYLPREDLEQVARALKLSLNTIYGVATFYTQFQLEPQGKHTISVCTGTACHVKGSAALLTLLEKHLGIKAGETTPDQQFSLQSVRCIGACSLAPAVMIDNVVHGNMTEEGLLALLKGL